MIKSFSLDQALNPWLQGDSSYKAGKTFEYVIEKYGFKRDEILRLAGNEATLGTSPLAIKAAQEASLSSNFYDEPYSESLIEALQEVFSKEGCKLKELGIVCGNGMDAILEHCFTLFTKPDRSIVVASPSFSYYKFAAQRRGVEVIDAQRQIEELGKSKRYKIDAESIIKTIQDNTSLVFLCTPNNPDGSVVSLEEIKKLADYCLEKNIIVFVDHAYIEFQNRDIFDARKIIADYPNMIIGYTFSKAYAMAGFRVGYGLMHKSMQAKFLSSLGPFLISKASIAAAKAALLDHEHTQKIINTNKQEKPLVCQGFEDLGYQYYQSEANFVLFETQENSSELLEKLMSKGIITRVMSPGTMRVTIGSRQENQRFLTALKDVQL